MRLVYRSLSWVFLGGALVASMLAPGCSAGDDAPRPSPTLPPGFGEPVTERAQAATGVCDVSAASAQACINQVQAQGGKVFNSIFKDSLGRTGPQLPVFGKLTNLAWPAQCTVAPATSGCNPGKSLAPFDCPGQYSCTSAPSTYASIGAAVNSLDRSWAQPCRHTNHAVNAQGCPDFSQCITDGVGGHYLPWEGLVFDMGGPSNKVAIFAENDHGPQPCESFEYTVFLTDDPKSRDIVLKPTTEGADPKKWNRAVLSEIFTEGWTRVRPPGQVNAACGDTANYAVEEDSFVQVFALPCGITFRYAAIVAGNDGLDFDKCGFDSQEAELDAVAGLTETGAGVCPDKDGDLFVDCSCVGAPSVCDCNDNDKTVYPGAPEKCDQSDKNCDGKAGACDDGLICYQSQCLAGCDGSCSNGAICTPTAQGSLCIPKDCSSSQCPLGSSCDPATKQCIPSCDGIVCPFAQVCTGGKCVDPCKDIKCPQGQSCFNGKCSPQCSCFKDNSGCSSGLVCDKGNSNACVPPSCQGKQCPPGQHCNSQGSCVDFCDGVVCPQDTDPCTADTCDLAKGCGHYVVPDSTPCPVSNKCFLEASCQAGVCTPANLKDCNDSNDCTNDFCDTDTGCFYSNKADGMSCDDGDACNGLSTCDAGQCQSGPAPDCDDNNPCTVDSCNTQSGCAHAALPNGSSCDDGDFCNGAETCQAGTCKNGAVPSCSDNDPCTVDSCEAGACKHVGDPCGSGGSAGSAGSGAGGSDAGSAGSGGSDAGAAGDSGAAGSDAGAGGSDAGAGGSDAGAGGSDAGAGGSDAGAGGSVAGAGGSDAGAGGSVAGAGGSDAGAGGSSAGAAGSDAGSGGSAGTSSAGSNPGGSGGTAGGSAGSTSAGNGGSSAGGASAGGSAGKAGSGAGGASGGNGGSSSTGGSSGSNAGGKAGSGAGGASAGSSGTSGQAGAAGKAGSAGAAQGGTSATAGASGAAGATAGAAGSTAGGAVAGSESGDDGGCGCRTTGNNGTMPAAPSALVALLALGTVARRRRSR